MNDFSIYFKPQMCLSTIKTITRCKKHIRPKQLWETIVVDIPALKPIIAKLIEELNSIVEL